MAVGGIVNRFQKTEWEVIVSIKFVVVVASCRTGIFEFGF
jgi:hypothetical protein